LKIFKQHLVWQLFHLGEQFPVEPFRLGTVAPAIKKDEGFTQINVLGLVMVDLPQHHNAAKNQESSENEMETILSAKGHVLSSGRVRVQQTESRAASLPNRARQVINLELSAFPRSPDPREPKLTLWPIRGSLLTLRLLIVWGGCPMVSTSNSD
jgi:hypothetical protein